MEQAPAKLWKKSLASDDDDVLPSLPIPHLVSHQAERCEYAAGSTDNPCTSVDLDSPCVKANEHGEDEKASTSPYDSTLIPEMLRLQPSELPADLRDRPYNFCRTTTVANLRKMAKTVSATTQGTKATLSTNVFVEAWKRISSVPQNEINEIITEWHRFCPCGDGYSYRDWLESPSESASCRPSKL
jgi:hypothetical protein